MSFTTRGAFAAFILSLPVFSPPTGELIAEEPTVRFSRDILPILSDRCFHCHGPDESHREADLRLDVHDEAIADRGGYSAIVPGMPDESEIISRVLTEDDDLLMPPPDSHRKPLTETEIQTLRSWIASGATWGKHWAFEPPIRLAVAENEPSKPIDALVRRRLSEVGMTPSPTASKSTLIRRASFDLIGLPPTAEEVDAFQRDTSDDAYEKLIDRLLQSPHHGERMAMWWLDVARYADTDGFQGDATRTNWPYRDWVVNAFHRNQPFDQFTIEQFAGDLLPEATPEQILATCFHRNHMTNGEGGRDPEESRIDYVIDRVNTTGTVWLGLTLGCTQCHSHKFDPISHQDYYSLFAFFNSIDEDGKAGDNAKPYLKYESPAADGAVAEAQAWSDRCIQSESEAKEAAQKGFGDWLSQRIASITNAESNFTPWTSPIIRSLDSNEGTVLTQEADGAIVASGPTLRQDDYRIVAQSDLPNITGFRIEVLRDDSLTDGKWTRGKDGIFILTNIKLQVRKVGDSQVREIDVDKATANIEVKVKGRNYGLVSDTLNDDPRNGWTLAEDTKSSLTPTAVFALSSSLTLAADEELILWMMHRSTEGDANIGRFRISLTDQPGLAVRSVDPMPIEELAKDVASEDLSDDSTSIEKQINTKLRERLVDQFLFDHPEFQAAKQVADSSRRHLASAKKAAGKLNVMVLGERKEPRETYVLQRGVWDQKGDAVTRGFPAAILPQANDRSLSRLDLATWLVDPQNPLTARVIVNHLWQIAFGDGLVRTPEDFGLQGEPPAHPDVLDWLAVELIESGWDVRHVLRMIVTSDTYKQRSETTATATEADPDNRMLARGARYRLPSWMIRDAALHSSGLLNATLGGPPVMPYQPPGVWEEIFMGRYTYEPSPGPAQYRRTLYAFWRRSSAPTFLFDSAQRRVCEVKTMRTNTPLHALTLLNDVGMLEAAAEIARRSIASHEKMDSQLTQLFRRILSRDPDAAELDVMRETLSTSVEHFAKLPDEARTLTSIGQAEPDGEADQVTENPAELAAFMIVASLVMNLDEAISHE